MKQYNRARSARYAQEHDIGKLEPDNTLQPMHRTRSHDREQTEIGERGHVQQPLGEINVILHRDIAHSMEAGGNKYHAKQSLSLSGRRCRASFGTHVPFRPVVVPGGRMGGEQEGVDGHRFSRTGRATTAVRRRGRGVW